MINFLAGFKSTINKYSSTSSIENYANAAGIGVVDGRLYVSQGNGVEAVATLGSSGAEVVTATNVITAAESGKTFFLNSATEFVSTLPAPALGLKYRFIVKAAPSGASYTIVTNASANIIKGHVLSSDLNAASDADFETSGGDTISFVDSKAVAGDWVDVECDGTNWFASGRCTVFDAITITTAS
jgi:hypothetical protein